MKDPEAGPILIEEGQRVRLDFFNDTDMWHPDAPAWPHVPTRRPGPRKDCHNAYHGEAGMMANVAYQA
ncbi:putative multicopper oxidase [Streptomyces lincolnensis]|uniref:Putative multicopper oxidase n=1 Tax=Streptomyces lincolnensis TaxID=1915 RepID=A0A1B1MM62_STRLN|nr:putative multicopper oxidase [Streptomyces lincolnensis]AXG58605.1 putative multicopper oxidase [Streptomyces lincolnensis]